MCWMETNILAIDRNEISYSTNKTISNPIILPQVISIHNEAIHPTNKREIFLLRKKKRTIKNKGILVYGKITVEKIIIPIKCIHFINTPLHDEYQLLVIMV